LQTAIFLTIEFPKYIERSIVDEGTLTAGLVDNQVAEMEAQ